jgi:hypothetical protein
MRSACVVRCMSSLELSSGAGTAAARRRGSARPHWSSAARSDAEPGGRGPASCKHVRSPEARQIECKAAARAAQGAGRTRATHAATRRAPLVVRHAVGHDKKPSHLGDVDGASFPHNAFRRVGIEADSVALRVGASRLAPRVFPSPPRAASELDGARIAQRGRPARAFVERGGARSRGLPGAIHWPCSRATTLSRLMFARYRRHHVREGRCHRW